jgi:hypothetical protein
MHLIRSIYSLEKLWVGDFMCALEKGMSKRTIVIENSAQTLPLTPCIALFPLPLALLQQLNKRKTPIFWCAQ